VWDWAFFTISFAAYGAKCPTAGVWRTDVFPFWAFSPAIFSPFMWDGARLCCSSFPRRGLAFFYTAKPWDASCFPFGCSSGGKSTLALGFSCISWQKSRKKSKKFHFASFHFLKNGIQ
jgi:hypothetical protein